MQTTRRVLLDDFLLFIGDAGDAPARNRAEVLLNRVLETVWMKREWSQFQMPSAYEVSLAAAARTVALPDYFGRIGGAKKQIRNLTKGGVIDPVDRAVIEDEDPYQGTSSETAGCPRRYFLAGTTPVQTQPSTSSAEALEVLSDSSSDTTVRAYVEGLNSSGIVTRAQVTLNGTTAVAVGSFKAPLTKFGKAYPEGTDPATEGTSSVGTVTLRKVTGGTVLQTLAPDQDARDHLTLIVYPVADAAYTLAIPIIRAVESVYRDADPLPPFWRNAVFEKMVMAWRVGDRDGALVDTADTWPALVDLVCFDNEQTRRGLTTTPFGGR